MTKRSAALIERLIEAARDSISANQVHAVRKDGLCRVSMQKVEADGRMATVLREMGVEIPPPLPEKTADDMLKVMLKVKWGNSDVVERD